MFKTKFKSVTVDGLDVFYREAGSEDAPILLLLHGFPTASHMFRDLIPALADRYHLIAPDMPGFGHSSAPDAREFTYSFDRLGDIMAGFVEKLGLDRFAIYLFDYGAPVLLRVAMRYPERITAIICQNGNAYLEGIGDVWSLWRRYWQDPTPENREACRVSLAPETIREWQYMDGADRSLVSPDGYTLDIAAMARPGAQEIQLDLILDYQNNLTRYPEFQEYFRQHKPPFLAAWGKNDRHFLLAGLEAYRRDLPEAEINLVDSGHSALETHHQEIAALIRDFLGRRVA